MRLLERLFERRRGPASQPPVYWSGRGQFEFETRPNRSACYQPVEVEWLDTRRAFCPVPETAEQVVAAFATADLLLREPGRWHDEIRIVAMRDGYAIWRDSAAYRDPSDPPLSPNEWWDEITIWFVYFDIDGSFEFMLYGGDGPLNGLKFVVRGNVASGADYATD